MILTLTLNPAIDYALGTDRIVYDDRTYITTEAEYPGGKGINAAQVIHAFGGQVHAIVSYGGRTGQRLAKMLRASHIDVTLIKVRGETRRNLAITDQQGLTIKLDHRGPPLEPEELDQIHEVVRQKLPGAKWLTLTGSLPPDTPADVYARLITLARESGVGTLLDARGEALQLGLEAGPSLAKPNRAEAERLLGRSLLTQAQCAEAAREIQSMGAERVIVSLGSQGAIAASENGLLAAIPPTIQSACPIGAGDVLAAACVWALSRGQPFEEAFLLGVAAATAAASHPGLTFAPLEEVLAMRKRLRTLSL